VADEIRAERVARLDRHADLAAMWAAGSKAGARLRSAGASATGAATMLQRRKRRVGKAIALARTVGFGIVAPVSRMY
jgi:hypothetical protein